MSFAQLDYVLNDYLTVAAGELLLPLGTYTERGAGWLNKIPDDPLAVDALLPGSGVGAELRGGIPVGDAGKLLNYEVYVVNGPGSSDTPQLLLELQPILIWVETWVSGPMA